MKFKRSTRKRLLAWVIILTMVAAIFPQNVTFAVEYPIIDNTLDYALEDTLGHVPDNDEAIFISPDILSQDVAVHMETWWISHPIGETVQKFNEIRQFGYDRDGNISQVTIPSLIASEAIQNPNNLARPSLGISPTAIAVNTQGGHQPANLLNGVTSNLWRSLEGAAASWVAPQITAGNLPENFNWVAETRPLWFGVDLQRNTEFDTLILTSIQDNTGMHTWQVQVATEEAMLAFFDGEPTPGTGTFGNTGGLHLSGNPLLYPDMQGGQPRPNPWVTVASGPGVPQGPGSGLIQFKLDNTLFPDGARYVRIHYLNNANNWSIGMAQLEVYNAADPADLGMVTVVFDAAGGTPQPSNQIISAGSLIIEPNPAPTRDFRDFLGWYFNDTSWDFAYDFADADMTLTARWSGIKEIVVTPATLRLSQGASRTFTVNANDPVVWEVIGNSSSETTISIDGRLTIGSDELIGGTLTVRAALVENDSMFGTATVRVYPKQIGPLPISRARANSWHINENPGHAGGAIDGNSNTIWHARWGASGSGPSTYGTIENPTVYFLDIDLGYEQYVHRLEIDKRTHIAHHINGVFVWTHPEVGAVWPNGELGAPYTGINVSQAYLDADFAMDGWVAHEDADKAGLLPMTMGLHNQRVTVNFPEAVSTRYVRMQILSHFPGATGGTPRMDFAAISEVRAFGYGEPFVDLRFAESDAPPPENPLSLWYRKPATVNAMNSQNDRLPIGNGFMGAMITGDIHIERLQFNEETLFSGGPGGIELDRDGNRGVPPPNAPTRPDGQATYNFGFTNLSPDRNAIYNQLATTTAGGGGGVPAAQIQGNFVGFGSYKNFGWLVMEHVFPYGETLIENYRRELDMQDGMARVSYSIDDVRHLREYFASYPDNVIVLRVSAENAGLINMSITAETDGSMFERGAAGLGPARALHGTTGESIVATGTGTNSGIITMTGELVDNGLQLAAVYDVRTTGGTIVADDYGFLHIADADSVTIMFSAATDWRGYALSTPPADRLDRFTRGATVVELGPENDWQAFTESNMTFRTGEDRTQLTQRVADVVQAAANDGFHAVLDRHQRDYRELFDRVDLNLGGENLVPTDQMLREYRALVEPLPFGGNGPAGPAPVPQTIGAQHQMLEVLQYQFARYLLISSSRPGTLPANLQGIWNDTNWPPWSADFHLNINLQMNYWPAGAANLLETIEPLRDLTEFLRITGRLTAQQWSYEAGTPADQWRDVDAGWTAHLGTTIWGLSSPGPSWGWGWHPTGNAFLSQNLYQYLQYGGCPDIFRRDYWPAIRTATIMWKEALFMPDHGPWEGYYVALPSYSPEYGPLTVATAYDQQLIWELFTMTLSIMDQLGIDDVQFAENVKYFRDNLYSPVSIGSPLNELPLPPGIAAEFPETGGIHPPVVQEWPGTPGVRLPTVGSQRSHRHMSHMVGLYPGTSVNMNDPIHAEAAINSLIMRGLGATGWSQGWKLNLWARSNDVERTYQMVNQMFALNIAPNLFGLHDVRFQIDANMGYAAGIHEMLLQSHLGTLDLLPTFPGDVWVNGHIRGIRSIGGHSIDMYWARGVLESAHITPHTTGDIGIRYSLFTDDDITVTLDGDPVIINEDGVLIVDAVAGKTFVIRLKSANDLEPEPVVFSGNNPNVLRALLEDNDVILKTAGNLGIFAHHSPFAIPAGRTLTVATTLNVQGNAELIIEGSLVVQEGGRVNNQGGAGGTIRIENGGRIINNGHVENVTNSTVINYGTIENNARFEVRANTTFCSCDGVVIGSVSINTHRNAITCENG